MPPVDEMRRILYQGPVFSLIEKSKSLNHKYMVLNSHAIFVYKDDLAFASFPAQPIIVLPLAEIATIEPSKIQKKDVLKSALKVSSNGDKCSAIQVMQVRLRISYKAL